MKQPAFVAIALCTLVTACNFSGDLEPYTNLVYQENFTDLSSNNWTNTADSSQFATTPNGYSFTLQSGQYQLTESTNNEIQNSNYFKSGATVFSLAWPYTLSFSLTFPTQPVTAWAYIYFNDYVDSSTGYETADCIILTSAKTYIVGYYNSANSDPWSFYNTGFVTNGLIKTGGQENTVEITQYANAFVISVNGERLGFFTNKRDLDDPVMFKLGIQKYSANSTAGEAQVLFDNIGIYN